MTPGYPKPRVRIIPVRVSGQCIALADDDADLIVLEFVASITGAIVHLPANPAQGKPFRFRMVVHGQTSFSTGAETVSIVIPYTRRGTSIIWSMSWGQFPEFLFLNDGWLPPDGIDYGGTAGGYPNIAIGSGSKGGARGVSVGIDSTGATDGVSIGYSSAGNSNGAGVGAAANASTNGACVGYGSVATTNGAAIGYQASTNVKDAAVALGYNSFAQRYREVVKSADRASTQLRSFSILDWYGDTTNATPTEILLGGTASQRLTLLAKSAFMFSILVVARDDTNNVVSSWRLEGAIKRDASNNTAIVGAVTKTLLAQDVAAATWDIAATADDTNEALVLTVTGAAATTIRWNAMATISEVRF